MTIKRYTCTGVGKESGWKPIIIESNQGNIIRLSELRELLEKKDKEAQEDFEENSVSCEDWKEQMKKSDDRLDHAEMMENACMEKDKALGKQELIGELLAELQDKEGA